MAETPLLFKAAITALASSYPLSYKENLFKLSYKLSGKGSYKFYETEHA